MIKLENLEFEELISSMFTDKIDGFLWWKREKWHIDLGGPLSILLSVRAEGRETKWPVKIMDKELGR